MSQKRFAAQFARQFHRRTRGLPPREIPLFTALRDTFDALSGPFAVQVIHGSRHQVTFAPPVPFGRNPARCELADLLIIAFRARPASIRMTFLQAKSERSWRVGPHFRHAAAFYGNLEQWTLLATRPAIAGIRDFSPPSNILKDAILPSVGTFGVFHHTGRRYELLYSAADNLHPRCPTGGRYGMVEVLSMSPRIRRVHDFAETVVAGSARRFALDLFAHRIGTPLHPLPNPLGEAGRRMARGWLSGILRPLAGVGNREVVANLLVLLDEADVVLEGNSSDRPVTVLIQTDA